MLSSPLDDEVLALKEEIRRLKERMKEVERTVEKITAAAECEFERKMGC